MNEARVLNIGYFAINKFAKKVDADTNLSKVFQVEDILTPMGCQIKMIGVNEMITSKFVQIFSVNNFEVCLLKGIDKMFKRVLLIQALGHYVLHGRSGKEECFISSASNSEASKEGFWFALSLLIPDEVFLQIYNKSDDKTLSNLFRVPEFAIATKRKLIENFYLSKEDENEK